MKGVLSMPHYDAIVIGSGQAGHPLSQKLADRGWAVALVEEEHLGGTCINTGCTPTKTMIASAQVAYYARNANRWGVRAGEVSVDLPTVVARKDRVVERTRRACQRLQIGKRLRARRTIRKAVVEETLERMLATLCGWHERADILTNVRGPQHAGDKRANATG